MAVGPAECRHVLEDGRVVRVHLQHRARGEPPQPVAGPEDRHRTVQSPGVDPSDLGCDLRHPYPDSLPLAPETRGLVSADVIAALPSSAVFVNVGRGELVDQAALTDALASGRLAGAGLDVFDPEPLDPDDALWDLPNVIISPHSSGSSNGTASRVADIFLDNLGRFVRRESLRNEVFGE